AQRPVAGERRDVVGRRVRDGTPLVFVVVNGRRDGGEREGDGERGAAALARALRTRRATVHLDQLAHDPEPDAEATMRPRGRAVGLAKTLEDIRQKAGADALPRIVDRDAGARGFRI